MKTTPCIHQSIGISNFASTKYNNTMEGGYFPQAIYRGKILMVSVLLVLFYCSGIQAQNYVYSANAEYGMNGGMRQYKVTDGTSYNSNGDPTIDLSMNCLAANGYGQWTTSSSVGTLGTITSPPWIFSPNQINSRTWDLGSSSTHLKGWFLLSNILAKPSEKYDALNTSEHPGCQPPGIVSGGEFEGVAFPSTAKVRANLNGNVRYVWVNPSDRSSFIVQGFNDERGPSSPSGQQQIDISLQGLPNPIANRQIIKNVIFNYPVGGNVSTGGHPVDNQESDIEEFEIAMDKKFLYITWVSQNTSNGNKREIWATAVLLSDGTPASHNSWNGTVFLTAPKLIQGCASCNIFYKRPTIDCAVRNNPTNPMYTAAWIACNGAAQTVEVAVVSNAVIVQPASGVPEMLPTSFKDPFVSTTVHNYNGPATHARILVSSVAGSSTPMTSVYVLVEPLAGALSNYVHDFILYKGLNFTGGGEVVGTYVDGLLNSGASKSYPAPVSTSLQILKGIKDEYIVAFANPYDNQSGTFNQYHCLYEPLYELNSDHSLKNPLVVLRGFDNGFANAGTTDTRLLLNQSSGAVLENATSYCGAVNQMGIHIHWREGSNHYYVRDIRAFDEPIEEHTFVTDSCIIADGSSTGSNHGGTVGAQIINGSKVTVWTDPNYGAGVTGGGLYTTYPGGTWDGVFLAKANIGTLAFNSTSLALTIGESIGDMNHLANFYTMPLCILSKSTNAGTITINSGGVWDYYGTPSSVNRNWDYAKLTVNINGSDPSLMHIPEDPCQGILNIHDTSVFWECQEFNCTYGRINILFENNLLPLNVSGAVNEPSSALLKVSNIATFDHSIVNSFLPRSEFVNIITFSPPPVPIMTNVVMEIIGFGEGTNSSEYTLHSTNTSYVNTTPESDLSGIGIAVVLYHGDCEYGPDKVIFAGGNFDRMRFRAINPKTAGLELQNMTVSGINQFMINIQRTCSTDYRNIVVSGNTFENILNDADVDADYAIRVEGFNRSDRYGELNVNDNILSFPYSTDREALDGGIQFINSTGNIERNQIINQSEIGITLMSTDGNSTFSYLCNNYISGLDKNFHFPKGIGILSDHYQGYINLCQIDGCKIGYLSKLTDHPSLFFSSIINCKDPGVQTGFSDCTFDMSGAHGPTSSDDDYAAFDTIKENGTTMTTPTQVLLAGGSHIEYGSRLQTWVWTKKGENNTIGIDNSGSTKRLLIATISGTSALGNIDSNFWGSGVDPVRGDASSAGNSPGLWDAARTKEYSFGITYELPAHTETSETGITDIDCGGFSSNSVSHGKGVQPLSVTENIDSCQRWHGWLSIRPKNQEEFKMQYDTLRHYLESCGKNDDSYDVFPSLSGAVQRYAPNDTTRYESYRAWLISVLYLNTTQPYYFCNCMLSIAGTFQYGKYYPLGYLTVINYLREHHPDCGVETLNEEFTKDSTYYAQQGLDVIHLPSLDSMGLGFLLHPSAVASPSLPLSTKYLSSFSSNPNPFQAETTLQFNLNRMTYTTVSLFDELGKLVWGDGRGSSLEAGKHSIHLEGKTLPHGVLYARISTGFGEVKTVKLVHE